MIFSLFGIVNGLLLIIANIPYIINAVKGRTQPHRVTWFLVFVLNIIAFANQAASGATTSLWIFVGGIIATFLVFLVSIPKGVGGFTKMDMMILSGAGLGLLLWWFLDSPLASIIMNMIVATIALIPTYKKSYQNPESETKITWLIASVGAIFGIISVGRLDITLLLLPVYSFFAQALMYAILETRD